MDSARNAAAKKILTVFVHQVLIASVSHAVYVEADLALLFFGVVTLTLNLQTTKERL